MSRNFNGAGLGVVAGKASNGVLLTTNSPKTVNSSSYQTVDPFFNKWEFRNIYQVTIKAAAFGSSGFGSVSVPTVHNSPPKTGNNASMPLPCDTTVTNVATATGNLGTTPLTASATATVVVKRPPTKFYVVDSSVDSTFEYAAVGQFMTSYGLNSKNKNPRDITTQLDGTKVWVINDDGKSDVVFVYSDAGASLGSWIAKTNAGKDLGTPEGIATDGVDIWIVDDATNTVYRYANAATLTSGSRNASSSFTLAKSGGNTNTNPRGITTDGIYLWVVDNSSTDRVFKYTVAGGRAVLGPSVHPVSNHPLA